MRPLILTARMDAKAQAYFDSLRTQHFPRERNFLRGHVTLFHALPGAEQDALNARIEQLAGGQNVMSGHTSGLRSLGRGVAFVVQSEDLKRLRAELAEDWKDRLNSQDRQRWQPHITVQNKVAPETARHLLQQLQREFAPARIAFEGLDLWHYEGGPWELARSYEFSY